MYTSVKTQTKHSASSLSLGVVIIFSIITILFIIALWQSSYTKKIFSAKTEQFLTLLSLFL
jgi:hypothetical protein